MKRKNHALGLVLVLTLFFATIAGCKKRKLPTVDVEPETSASASPAADEPATASPAVKRAAPKPTAPPVVPIAAPPVPGTITTTVVPTRALEPAFGFPVPESLKIITSSPGTALYESQQTIETLRRFYTRELGPGATLVDRMYGFEVRAANGNSSLLVTRAPGDKVSTISVVAPSPARIVKRAPQ